ncbi:NAD(P)/FAD-dependent oxidoreductase [Pseudanabaena sp. PCC 6802]|uniref:NAD(P)/FAD-dependent oxidoreductase n=1 Tax=Pseudanabaena sp. PCC 6802 TaxID=118173 RepID=UPI000349A86C|nr:NAD(P)/FAD-dependent oxidoreductase [Pseudanabaena sp. PCC 6802]
MQTIIANSSDRYSSAKADPNAHHVVVVGGGFGGLYAAKELGKSPVQVTLLDKRNFHLFQPLLYQVATGGLSPADIASPLRAILAKHKNTRVLMGEVTGIDTQKQTLITRNGETIDYDTLVVATGVSHHYFGNDCWAEDAPGLKTLEDAVEMRRRILLAFEKAEKECDPQKRRALLTFAIVGGGPTGVELAGALAELAHGTLKSDFSSIDTTETEIVLIEGTDRILPTYPADLSLEAARALKSLGVQVKTQALVTEISDKVVAVRSGDRTDYITAENILWAAGVQASSMGKVLADCTGVQLDRAGRVIVEPDLSIANYPNIFVIGDLANYAHQGNKPLPGIAPVAMQQGKYVADLIEARLVEKKLPAFRYADWGNLAVIGKHAAVVDMRFLKFTGIPAWLIWTFLHIYYLIEFDNKLLVLTQWAWNYFTKQRGARLITGGEKKDEAT